MGISKFNLYGMLIDIEDAFARRKIGIGNLLTVKQTLIGGLNELFEKIGVHTLITNDKSLSGAINEICKNVDDVNGGISSVNNALNDVNGEIEWLKDNVGNVDLSEIENDIEEINTRIESIEENSPDISGLIERVDGVEDVAQNNEVLITQLSADFIGFADKISDDVVGVSGRVGTLGTTVSNFGTNLTNLDSKITSVSNECSGVIAVLDSVQSNVGENTTNIGLLNETLTGVDGEVQKLKTSVSTNTTNITSVTNKANTNATNITSVTTKANTNATNISSLTTKVNTNTSSISTLKSGKSNLISVTSHTPDNITINASSGYVGTHTLSRSGYTPLGIIGFNLANASSGGQNVSQTTLYKCYINADNNIGYAVRNLSGSATAKIKIGFDVLWVKNS